MSERKTVRPRVREISYTWVAKSHILFPVEFGEMVFEEGECEKDID